MKLIKPYKNASPFNISQGYIPLQPDGYIHQAIDVAGTFGEFLVAPFDGIIERIVSAGSYGGKTGSTDEVHYGCGISIVSTQEPSYKVVYWHCLEHFPVSVGQTVKAGQPIAQMGNLGLVSMGGIMVSVEEREKEYAESTPTNLPKKGVHVHMELVIDGQFVDPSKYIDWNAPVNFDLLTAIKATLQNISNYLKS